MSETKKLTAMQSWSSVGKWTLCGTLTCVLVSVGFNALMFEGWDVATRHRAMISAIVLPIVMGLPLFFFMSMRLRGLVLSNLRLDLVARTDSLTACLNRGAFTNRVSMLLAHDNGRATGALLMIDADNFKSINDLYGHDSGDEALAIIARSIRAVLRPGDLVGRMGGEEFGVYLPGVVQQGAEAIAERIRRSVNLAVFSPDARPRQLSVSIGGAVFDRPAIFSELFHIADQRLYGAKQTGRNRVTIVHATDYPELSLHGAA